MQYPFDIVVNSAGTAFPAPALEMTPEDVATEVALLGLGSLTTGQVEGILAGRKVETEAGFASGVLQATVAQYNRDAERGEDPLFGKRPEFLVPLRNAPYALLDCRAADGPYSGLTAGGLATSADGEVLDIEGAPIPGLYAAGRTAALFCGRGYAGSGISLADGTFFGRRAGRHAAQKR